MHPIRIIRLLVEIESGGNMQMEDEVFSADDSSQIVNAYSSLLFKI